MYRSFPSGPLLRPWPPSLHPLLSLRRNACRVQWFQQDRLVPPSPSPGGFPRPSWHTPSTPRAFPLPASVREEGQRPLLPPPLLTMPVPRLVTNISNRDCPS